METQFLLASFINLGINIGYTVIALFIAVYALLIIDKKLLKDIDIQQELRNNNLAVSIFASTILIFVAFIISFGLKA